jgi:hypothetical protein
MKFLLLLLVSLSFLPFTANAGNMFGPAPFRNGSPLVTGVDGTYQATASDTNIIGIFRFQYSAGSQTSNLTKNSWIFFREGRVMKGTVEAAIDGSSLSGILAQQAAQTASTNTNATFPLILTTSTSDSVGNFNGKLNLKSPSGAFSGSGVLQSAAGAITTTTIINTNNNGFVQPPVSVSVTNGGGVGFTNNFQFRGVKTSVSSTRSSTN